MRKLVILLIGLLVIYGLFREEPKKQLGAESVQVCSSHSMAPQTIQASPRVEAPQEVAQLDMESLRKKWSVKDYHKISATEFKSPLGKTLVYSFSQGTIPIVGMTVRIRMGLDGMILEEENTYSPIPPVEINEQEVEEKVINLTSQREGRFDYGNLNSNSLVILKRENLSEGELAISTSAQDTFLEAQPVQLLLRLDDGKLLMKTKGRSDFGT